MRAAAFVFVLSMALLSTAALADVPGLINYQGTLTDQYGVAADTTLPITFTIYTDSTGGSTEWTETQPAVEVNNGLFNVLLGRVNALSDDIFSDPERWLGVQVGADPELVPRQRIAAVGYAFRAAEADTADFSRSALAVDDGDWTIDGDDVYHEVGNVGIGTTGPTSPLTIQTISGTDIEFTGGGYNTDIMAPSTFKIGTTANQYLHLMTNDMYRLCVTGEGNVGIGTTSPNRELHVVSSLSGGGIKAESPSAPSIYLHNSGTGQEWTMLVEDGTGKFILSNPPIQAIVVDTSGNVGIGTPNLYYKFQVKGDIPTFNDVLVHFIGIDDGTDDMRTLLSLRRNPEVGPISAGFGTALDVFLDNCISGNLQWTTQGGQGSDTDLRINQRYNNGLHTRVMVQADGNVGIGTATPGSKLEVAGQVKITGGAPGAGKVLTSDADGLASWATPPGLPSGVIVMWSGTLASIPTGWALCDGSSGTPDLRDRFMYGVSTGEDPGATGGSASHSHTVPAMAVGWDFHSPDDNGFHYPTSVPSGDIITQTSAEYFNLGTFGGRRFDQEYHLQNQPIQGTVTGANDAGGLGGGVWTYRYEVKYGTTETQTDSVSALPPYFKLAFIMKL